MICPKWLICRVHNHVVPLKMLYADPDTNKLWCTHAKIHSRVDCEVKNLANAHKCCFRGPPCVEVEIEEEDVS